VLALRATRRSAAGERGMPAARADTLPSPRVRGTYAPLRTRAVRRLAL
jgi:hypothetical protein